MQNQWIVTREDDVLEAIEDGEWDQGIVTREDDVLEAIEDGEWDQVPDLLAAMYPHERRQLAAAIEDKTFEGIGQIADLHDWQRADLMRLLDDARDGRL